MAAADELRKALRARQIPFRAIDDNTIQVICNDRMISYRCTNTDQKKNIQATVKFPKPEHGQQTLLTPREAIRLTIDDAPKQRMSRPEDVPVVCPDCYNTDILRERLLACSYVV